MRLVFVGVFFISLFSDLFAQPDGYYNSAEGKYGDELQAALHDIIDNHTVVSYASLWQHFQVTDKKADGKVWDMYSDIPGATPPYEYTFVSDQCGNYSGEGSCYNREHSFPKSWFNDQSPMNTDMFHLYPTDGYVNGKRSNFPFGETNQASWTSLNGSKVGSSSVEGYTGTVFEPIDAYKGDFARTYFYMSTRYLNEDSGWSGSGMTDGAQLEPWAVRMLLEWHRNDTVSAKEINRNNGVYVIQKNRNPYIDRPEYVERIWGDADSSATAPVVDSISVVSASLITVWYNRTMDPATSLVNENYSLDNGGSVSGVAQHGLDFSAVDLSVDLPQSGSYALSVSNVADLDGNKIVPLSLDFEIQLVSSVETPANNFSIFPNPSSGIIIISSERQIQNRRIQVFSVTGEMILSRTGQNAEQVDLSNHPDGVYFLRIIDEIANPSLHKIILYKH